MFFYTLEERGPFHEVCEVEVEVIVFGEGVEVAEVELQKVAGSDSADGRHLLLIVLGLLKILAVYSNARRRRRQKKGLVREASAEENLEIPQAMHASPAGAAFSSSPATPNYDMHGQNISLPIPLPVLTHFRPRDCLVWKFWR